MSDSYLDWKPAFRKEFVRGHAPMSLPSGEIQEAEAWIEAEPEEVESFIQGLLSSQDRQYGYLNKANSEKIAQLESQLSQKSSALERCVSALKSSSELLDKFGPKGCGNCGNPNASCDGECADAYNLGMFLSSIYDLIKPEALHPTGKKEEEQVDNG